MLKLYYHPFSTYARRVRIALLEKKISYELVHVDMEKRAHRAADYLALNPHGQVPTLQEDDFVISESTAILNYLEAVHPQPPLAPADARGRALVDMHMKICDLQFTKQMVAIVFPKRFLPKERWDLDLFAKMKTEIEKHLAIVDRQLGSNEYLVRNAFSLADICYLPFLEFLPLTEVQLPAAVEAWRTRLQARDSSVQTKPDR